MRLIKQIPLDAPSIVRMDAVIGRIGSLLHSSFSSNLLRADEEKNLLARGIDVFMCITLGVDDTLIRDSELLDIAAQMKVDLASFIEKATTELLPLLRHGISRGVPQDRIIEYCLEAFIERLLLIYPNYTPILLENLFK